MKIKGLCARIIKDSRGKDTIEVSVNGCGASSPSGTSAGKHETKPWHKSIDWNVREINRLQTDIDFACFDDLKKIEDLIARKFKLRRARDFGANALFALESAILKALAKSEGKQLWEIVNPEAKVFPRPLGNAVGGGLHSQMFKNHPTFQEFLLIPNEGSFEANVAAMKLVYNELGNILKAKNVNYEGAWNAEKNEAEILSMLARFSGRLDIGIDVAASSFYKNGKYSYPDRKLTGKEQIDYVNTIIEGFGVLYIEDGLNEDDFSGFAKLNKGALICGDDLTVTDIGRLKKAIKKKSINAMIIKPNQNGSLMELKEIFKICRDKNIATIVSHRSGETMDDALADYAFAFGADFIKCGIATKWREAKLKRLIEIEKRFK